MNKAGLSELRWVIEWAAVIVLLSSLPYLWGAYITPPGYSFTGLTHNIDDGAVYLSWMRQSADGHFFITNLFTNDPQPARQFNLLFLVMGWTAAITHLPLVAVFHVFRVVLGIALILGIWQLSKLFLEEEQRRMLVPLVGLSAGVGWLIPNVKMPVGSVDMWQPEAITFLSIYLNPLFLAGLLLMVGAFYWLERMRREGRVRYAVIAGLHLLVLGNVHTYDVLTVACVWIAYVIALHLRFAISDFGLDGRTIALSVIAALIAAPSAAYQFWVYSIDPVYRARANSPIPSPPIWGFFEGYGLVLIGALAGVALLSRAESGKRKAWLLPITWAVLGFAVPYIPIAQQRKLVMGLHIPLCMLCAYALAILATRLPVSVRRMALIALLVFMAASNVRFMALDTKLLAEGRSVTQYSPYLSRQELTAMRYLRAHAKPKDAILAPPQFSLFAPALTGRAVWYGHWSETPDYLAKLSDWRTLGDPTLPPAQWGEIVEETGAAYYVSEMRSFDSPACLGLSSALKSGPDLRVYKLDASLEARP